MQVPTSLVNLTANALAESLDMDALKIVADRIFQYYDFYGKTGFSRNLDIPRQVAAKQFVNDVKAAGFYLKLVQVMMDIHAKGYMGKKYPINKLRQIIAEIREKGIIYDSANKIFVEDPSIRRTKNWGTLIEGEQYLFSLLRLDIAGNSKLVRQYPDDVIQATYSDFRNMVQDTIDKRNGRIWSWEGDGGLVAFFFSNKNMYATCAGMDLVNKLFIYNHTACRLNEPLNVRLAVHSGLMDYTGSEQDLKRSDIVKTVMDIEANHTSPNSLTVSDVVVNTFSKVFLDQFNPVRIEGNRVYYHYSIKWQ